MFCGRAPFSCQKRALPNICFASDRRSYREAGVTGYIAKPVSVHVLENALTVIEP